MNMRVLIADRNARLLESVARTFARQFSIQTATTHERCNELLLQGEFDLAVVSEKLADAPGLQLLGQIARNSPDTLRVFAARKSRLRLLKGKLGPFGLFRTLAYPIDPQELLSALTLARTGLEVDAPALEARNALAPETRYDTAAGTRAVPARAAARAAVEQISLTSADAMFTINVPVMIASITRVRRSGSSSAPRPMPVAPQVSAARHQVTSLPVRIVTPESPDDAPQPPQSRPRSIAPHFTPTQQAPQPKPQPAVARAEAPSQIEAVQHTARRRKKADKVVPMYPQRTPLRTKLVLGGTIAAVFLVTTFTLNLFDASVHVTRASTRRPAIARADIPAPPATSTPVLAPALTPAPRVAKRAPGEDEESESPQIAASAAPAMADPSSFGSEAYEPSAGGY